MSQHTDTSRPDAEVIRQAPIDVGRVPAAGAEMALLARSTSMLHRCCLAVGSLATMGEDEQGAWLDAACRALCGLQPGVIAAQIVIAQSVPTHTGWKARHVAVAGAPDERTHEHATAEAAECWPFDDVTSLAGWRPVGSAPTLFAREERVGLERWLASGFRKHRAAMGLHDYLRVLIPYEAPSSDALFALQIDGLDPNWRPDAQMREAAAGVAPFVFRAFFSRFEARDLLRARLLERLTPAQGALPPMLASGLTEAEIAQQLDRSPHTVHEWVRGVYKAWGIRSRFQLREIWMGRGSPAPLSRERRAEQHLEHASLESGATPPGRADSARARRRGPR